MGRLGADTYIIRFVHTPDTWFTFIIRAYIMIIANHFCLDALTVMGVTFGIYTFVGIITYHGVHFHTCTISGITFEVLTEIIARVTYYRSIATVPTTAFYIETRSLFTILSLLTGTYLIRDVNTSACWVTEVICTSVMIITIHRCLITSTSGGVTLDDGTIGVGIRAYHGDVYTITTVQVTMIIGTFILVVTLSG